jgi:hypothetical protein
VRYQRAAEKLAAVVELTPAGPAPEAE